MTANIDYVISAIRHSRGQKRIIDSVKQHRLYVNSVGQCEEASRKQVISNIDVGMIYYTAVFTNGRFTLGDRVIKYPLPSGDYIRTDGNRTEGDNLGSLPPF